MKKLFWVIGIVVLFSSCTKEDLGIKLPEMNATIDGAEWNTVTRLTVLEGGNKFIITGTSAQGEILAITVFGTTTGTYKLNLEATTCAAVFKESVSTTTEDAYVSVTGEVKLTDVDKTSKKISGVFSFTLVRGLTNHQSITGGVFNNLNYTEQEAR